MPYRVTFQLAAFNGTRDPQESIEDLSAMLDCLVRIDENYLRRRPNVPLLYEAGVRYEEEPLGAEFWRDIPTCLEYRTGDCLPASTLVLTRDYKFTAIINLRPGDEIMEDGQPTTVQECAITGDKPVLAFGLSNGCVLRLSPDHRVFTSDDKEVRAEHVRVGDELRTPTKPFPTSDSVGAAPYPGGEDFARAAARFSPEDFAWLVGTYIADGWCSEDYRFSISGDDENPKCRKAEQKQRTRAMMESIGVATRWSKKAITVNDGELARAMKTCGTHAPTKELPTMAWSRPQVDALLEGLATDSSTAVSGTVTYGTTSHALALQTRVLFRMRDQSVHIREWSADQHKGFGRNSMYRIGVRRPADECVTSSRKTAAENFRTTVRVRSITEEEPELMVDITTSAGRFYLPESDVMVHNCEDLSCWLVAEKRVRFGIPARPIIIPQLRPPSQARPEGSYLYHIAVWSPDVPGGIIDPSKDHGMP